MITQDTIRNIMDAARIDEVVGEFVTLKKRGSNLIGLCPFHNEKTPSFTVSQSKGIYKCFGCGKAGDVVKFMMEHDQLSYPESLRFLASKYGIEVEEDFKKEENVEEKNLRESLYLVNAFAAEEFEKNLWEHEKGRAIALSYFMNRGFDEKTIKAFHIGYCLEGEDSVSKAALEKGYEGEYLEKTGLSIQKNGHYRDRFWGRVMFPIHNISGRIIGFGGRTLRSDKKVAKYVNSPESEIYNKSRELYGLYFTKRDVVKEDECYLVEGYTDVVSLYQSGVTNSAAPLGTSLTEDQVKLIRRYTKNVILLFDGDEAGMKATERAIGMLLESGLNAHVVLFPDGQDPDSYSKKHSDEELKRFLKEEKMDFISFFLKSRKGQWEKDPVKKADLMKDIIGNIAKIPDHLLRSLFIKDFAQKTEVDEQSAIYELNRIRRKILKGELGVRDVLPEPDAREKTQQQKDRELIDEGAEKKEEKIVSFLLKYPDKNLKIKGVNKSGEAAEKEVTVPAHIITELERDGIQFRKPEYKSIYTYYRDRVMNGEEVDERKMLMELDENAKEAYYNLVTPKYELSQNWKEKYYIETPEEEDFLLEHINRDLHAMKLSEIMIRLNEFEERMKEATDEELVKLIKQQRALSAAKKAFADKLGMTIK